MDNREIDSLTEEFGIYLSRDRKLKENTVVAYLNDIRKLSGSFGAEILSFGEDEIKSYLDILKKRGKADSGISRTTGSLRAFYHFLYVKGKIDEDFSSRIKYNKTERKTPEILSSREIGNIFLAITDTGFKGARDKALLELMYATGLKATEIINLKKSDINFKRNMVNCKSDEKTRKIPLYPAAADALRSYTANYSHILRGCKFLFVNTRGGQITRQGLWKIIGEYAKAAGIKKDISPSVLRNSFAAHLLENGADLKSVQEMMGHTSVTSTKIYEKIANNRISRVYKSAHPRARQ